MKKKKANQHNIKKQKENFLNKKYSSMIIKYQSLNLNIFSNLICDNK